VTRADFREPQQQNSSSANFAEAVSAFESNTFGGRAGVAVTSAFD
jgi:hypothetical protein